MKPSQLFAWTGERVRAVWEWIKMMVGLAVMGGLIGALIGAIGGGFGLGSFDAPTGGFAALQGAVTGAGWGALILAGVIWVPLLAIAASVVLPLIGGIALFAAAPLVSLSVIGVGGVFGALFIAGRSTEFTARDRLGGLLLGAFFGFFLAGAAFCVLSAPPELGIEAAGHAVAHFFH